MIEWSEADFVRCFDGEPVTGEQGDSRRFTFSRNDLELEVILWPQRLDALVTLRHRCQELPLRKIIFHGCFKAVYLSSGGSECLLFMKVLGGELWATFRVQVHPEFLLAFDDFVVPAARPAG